MTAVILVAPNNSEVTVGSLPEFVELVFGQGYHPKTGSIDSNKAALHGGAAPSPDPAALVRLGDLQTPTSDATVALRAAYVPKWKPSTAYASGEFVLNPSGQIVSANATFTSGTTYSATNWTVISGGGGGAVSSVAGRTGAVTLTSTDLTDSTTTGQALVAAASAAAARTTLGLGTAAAQPTTAFDAAGAAAAVLPIQTGNSGKFLTTDGTNPSWGTPAGGGGTSPYTVLGNSNGTDDTSTIQAALTPGGYIKGKPGQTYKISAPLVIGAVAGTILDMHGCTVSLNASSNCNMLTTPGVTQGATVTSRASRVRVLGGVWDRGSNGGTGNAQHNLVFRGVDDLLVRDVTVQSAGGKYAICCEQVSDYTIERIRFGTGAFSDGVHIQGGCFRGTIRDVKGHTGDDIVSVTPLDWAAFTWGDEGDVIDLLIEDIELVNGGSRFVIITEGNGKNVQRVTVRTVRGSTTAQDAIKVWADGSSANTMTGASLDDILIEDVMISTPSTKCPVVISTDINVDSVTVRDVQVLSDVYAVVQVNQRSGAVVKRLTVDGVRGAFTSAASPVVLIDTGGGTNGGVNRLKLSNIDVTAPTQASALLKSRNTAQTLNYVDMVNVVSDNFFWLVDATTTTTVHLANVTQITPHGLINVNTGGAVTAQLINCTVSTTNATAGTGTLVFVPPTALYTVAPSFHKGMLGWSFDPGHIAGGVALNNGGKISFVYIPVPLSVTVTNVLLYVTTAGATLTASQNWAGLYDAAGNLLSATADQSTAWTSTGLKTMALSAAQAVRGGSGVYVAFVVNGTTAPTLARSVDSSVFGTDVNLTLGTDNQRCAQTVAGNTTLPSTLAITGAQNLPLVWVGLS